MGPALKWTPPSPQWRGSSRSPRAGVTCHVCTRAPDVRGQRKTLLKSPTSPLPVAPVPLELPPSHQLAGTERHVDDLKWAEDLAVQGGRIGRGNRRRRAARWQDRWQDVPGRGGWASSTVVCGLPNRLLGTLACLLPCCRSSPPLSRRAPLSRLPPLSRLDLRL